MKIKGHLVLRSLITTAFLPAGEAYQINPLQNLSQQVFRDL